MCKKKKKNCLFTKRQSTETLKYIVSCLFLFIYTYLVPKEKQSGQAKFSSFHFYSAGRELVSLRPAVIHLSVMKYSVDYFHNFFFTL